MNARIVFALLIAAAVIGSCSQPPAERAPATVAIVYETATPEPTQTFTPVPPTPMSACVVANSLNVRQQPSKQGAVVAGLTKGTCVTVYGKDATGKWGSISSPDVVGWVALEYLDLKNLGEELPIVDTLANGDEVAEVMPTPALATSTWNPPTTAPRMPNTAVPQPPSVVNCANTASRVGDFVTCRMTRAYCSYQPSVGGNPTFCNDAPYPGNAFTLLVWGSDWSDLDGKCIMVSGLVQLYKGKPEIVAASRSQVSPCK